MEVRHVSTPFARAEFPLGNYWGSNKVDLLIGRNGSGKTDVLTALTQLARTSRNPNSTARISWMNDREFFEATRNAANPASPICVVAQTFSPFTRFRKSDELDVAIPSAYFSDIENDFYYRCIGLHRSYGYIGASLSSRLLERSIYRLSEDPRRFSNVFNVMDNLGFQRNFTLVYQVSTFLARLMELGYDNHLPSRTANFLLNEATGGIAKDVARLGTDQLEDLLSEAFRLLYDNLRPARGPALRERATFKRTFGDSSFRDKFDFAALQSLALLRRLGLLSLQSFLLTELSGKGKTKPIEVAKASSGQQQMLCSVIGLSSAITNNSLILIDEPELSLHPRWQQLYLEYLSAALEAVSSCHVIIATHSPLIAQSAARLGVTPTRMDKELNEYSHESSIGRASNLSVEGTLLDVFETPLSDSVELANDIFAAITLAEDGDEQERALALEKLKRLQEIYEGAPAEDLKSKRLLNDAVTYLLKSA
jgi:ABC-type phosphate transport system ATPase subunit